GDCLALLARVRFQERRYSEAEATWGEALTIQRKMNGSENMAAWANWSNCPAWTRHDLAHLYEHQGKLAEAEAMHHEALTIGKKMLGDTHPDVGFFRRGLFDVMALRGKLPEAEA